jgi:hypothetical protein
VEEQAYEKLLGKAVTGLHIRSRIAEVDQPLDHQVLRVTVAGLRSCPHRLGRLGIAHCDQELGRVSVAVAGERPQFRDGFVVTPVDEHLDQQFPRVPPAMFCERPQLDQ